MSDPVLVSIAAALAGKAVTSLYDLVKKKFLNRGTVQVLDAADSAHPDSTEVQTLADELAAAERDDPQFAEELRATWHTAQHADHGGVNNQINGHVHGKALQARDIHGDVHF